MTQDYQVQIRGNKQQSTGNRATEHRATRVTQRTEHQGKRSQAQDYQGNRAQSTVKQEATDC
jgi:hypothetical protein